MNIKHGMVLAAGLGKRMQPLTLKTPKPLLEINNISLIERAINLLVNHGVTEISINIHYLPEQIQSFLKNSLSNKGYAQNIHRKYINQNLHIAGLIIKKNIIFALSWGTAWRCPKFICLLHHDKARTQPVIR